MKHPLRLWSAILILGLVSGGVLSQPGGKDKQPAKSKLSGEGVFGLAKIHDFHLELSAKDWEIMQATKVSGPFFGGPGGFKKPDDKPADKQIDVHKGSGFGVEFPWAHANFTAQGKTYKNVGARYKGNFTFMASAKLLRKPLQIDLEHYAEDQRFQGLKKINLANGVTDPERLRETLSFAVFREAGVPASRTAYAEVKLTVPAKYDKEYVGLYTMIEHVGSAFLKDHFKSAKGLLLKPEGIRGLEYLGENWEPYQQRYRPKTDASKKQQKRLMDFTRMLNKANDAEFRKKIGSFLDVDEFLRFLAANALLANLDSFLALGHNYYMYLRPDTDQFVFIPWDLDLSFGNFPMAGTAQQQEELSLQHPHMGDSKLIDRLLAMPEVKEKYQKILKDLSKTVFAREKLLKDIDAIEKVTQASLAREKKAAEARNEGKGGIGFGPPGGMFGQAFKLRSFVEKRTASVIAQLEGKSKGFVPTMGFGKPGGPGGFGPGNFVAKPLLTALDADKDGKVSRDELISGVKKFFSDCDKDQKGSLTEAQLAAGLDRIWPQPKGFPGGPFPGGPFGGPAGPAQGVQVLTEPVKQQLKLSPEQRKEIEQLQKEVEAKLAKILSEEQNQQLKNLQKKSGPGDFLFGPPGGFGMGKLVASSIMKRADANKDGKVTLAELVAAAEALFKECDKGNKGSLDEGAIAAGISQLFPAPPAFGPPGGPKPPPKDAP
jgi:spore coat protein CotH